MCIFIDFEFLVSLDSEFQAASICNTYYVKKRHVNDVWGQIQYLLCGIADMQAQITPLLV